MTAMRVFLKLTTVALIATAMSQFARGGGGQEQAQHHPGVYQRHDLGGPIPFWHQRCQNAKY